MVDTTAYYRWLAHVRDTPELQGRLAQMTKPQTRQERLNWTAMKHRVAGEKYSASRSRVIKNKSKGTMLPLRRIAHKLGGDMKAAINWAKASILNNEFEICVR